MTDASTDDTERGDSSSESTVYHVTSVDDMEEGDRLLVDIDGQSLAIFRGSEEFYAISNYCQHQGGPMCKGRMLNPLDSTKSKDAWELSQDSDVPTVACPWHGWEYELETGEHVAPTKYNLPTYDTIVEDGELYVEV
ncbi:Rieske (2Fe-2S) protein [Halorussus ruber]|uniref:Rieske (2Fe-2S) protein n=1 Tax=Halorussus ruber TaxID=1126238 RepID=UPI001092F63D|nr:Rieske (2Fe-2S) protein [Halorussus ruber]